MSVHYETLINSVIEASESKRWEEAVQEWEVFSCDEDETRTTNCICGKEGLRYLFTIYNNKNGNKLFPIGSSCIKKFGVTELYEDASLWEKEFELYHAIENNKFITLKDGLFSRKLLYKLYVDGAFQANAFNGNNPYNDYKFMLDMFNKREPTEKQMRRCTAIILNSIKPFIKKKLNK